MFFFVKAVVLGITFKLRLRKSEERYGQNYWVVVAAAMYEGC
jgi:hypothetical protein